LHIKEIAIGMKPLEVIISHGKGFLLNQAKDLFRWGTGAIMTECSS